MLDEIAINAAIEESKINSSNNYQKGGPFGAVIVKDGKIIASSHNTVIEDNDPTAHAEINVIRKASKILNTHDLSGCILYVNCEPCPMCLSAIIWANIKEVYFANTRVDACDIGFRDDIIYEFLKGNVSDIINLHHIDSSTAKGVFDNFKCLNDKKLY